MARKRTKDQKRAVRVKRMSESSVVESHPNQTTQLSYQAPQASGVKPSPAPTPTSTLVQRDQTEAILRQPLHLIYQDLFKTGIVSVGIVGVLLFLVQYLK